MERFHRRLKDSLRARLAGPHWFQHLPWVLLGLRCTLGEASNLLPASSVYEAELSLPGEFLDVADPPSPAFLNKFRRRLDLTSPSPFRHKLPTPSPPDQATLKSLMSADIVFIPRDGHVPSLTPLYDGPYEVISRVFHSASAL